VKSLLIWAAAFAAGFVGWRVTEPGPTYARSSRRPPEGVGATMPASDAASPGREQLEALRQRLALVQSIPLRELVLHGKEPLAARMRRARALDARERRDVLREWAQGAVYDRDKAGEMLDLARHEEDREILAWLADMIDLACLNKMTWTPPSPTRRNARWPRL